MGLGLAVGSDVWPIGDAEVLHALFSTISAHCEAGGWGSRFPVLMHQLYQGGLTAASADAALAELAVARRELAALPAAAVVWDIDDPTARPPYGGPPAGSLAGWFVTPEGWDVFDMLGQALTRLRGCAGGSAWIVAPTTARSA